MCIVKYENETSTSLQKSILNVNYKENVFISIRIHSYEYWLSYVYRRVLTSKRGGVDVYMYNKYFFFLRVPTHPTWIDPTLPCFTIIVIILYNYCNICTLLKLD